MAAVSSIRATRPEPLWTLVVAPSVWMAHFLVTYATVALGCGRWGQAASAGGLATAIGVYTLAALAGIAACVTAGLRARRGGLPVTRLDDDTPESRRHFLASATILLALLSMIGVLFVAAATWLVPVCV